jgi:hypothetical protein
MVGDDVGPVVGQAVGTAVDVGPVVGQAVGTAVGAFFIIGVGTAAREAVRFLSVMFLSVAFARFVREPFTNRAPGSSSSS